MHPLRTFCLALLTAASVATTTPVLADEAGYILSVQLENDFFGGGTDRHFTHGSRLVLITEPLEWMTEAASRLPWVNLKKEERRRHPFLVRGTISLGQNIYTPEDTSNPDLVRDDRPYAGWLYLGFGVVGTRDGTGYDQLELNVGVVGPLSGAEEVQTGWHRLLNIREPEGWDHQLDNEPGVVLFYERGMRVGPEAVSDGFNVDLIPHFGGSLGNVFTYASAGFTIRIGQDLEGDFGPPRIRPSLPGAGYFRFRERLNGYFFLGVEGRAVLQNIFLDGNTFRDSHQVDKKTFVGDVQAGFSVQYRDLRITYTQIFRTREFEGQDSPDKFGSLSISVRF